MCVRCHERFPDGSALASHLMSVVPCELSTCCGFEDVVSSEMMARLRRHRSRHERSTERQWEEMWQILFPSDEVLSLGELIDLKFGFLLSVCVNR